MGQEANDRMNCSSVDESTDNQRTFLAFLKQGARRGSISGSAGGVRRSKKYDEFLKVGKTVEVQNASKNMRWQTLASMNRPCALVVRRWTVNPFEPIYVF